MAAGCGKRGARCGPERKGLQKEDYSGNPEKQEQEAFEARAEEQHSMEDYRPPPARRAGRSPPLQRGLAELGQ